MIWATVSSWSCFCWLYIASPPLAAKNIINLLSVLTIWWCLWVVFSLKLLEEVVCYDQVFSWQNLLAFALIHSVLQGQVSLLLQGFLDFLLLHSITKKKKSEEELKILLRKVKEESAKGGIKLNIQKTKIMVSSPITSWQIDGETMETVRDFIFFGLQNDCKCWLQPGN